MEFNLPVISLTTDFGLKDGNVGVMKGVIWGICPSAQIADISHMVGPQNVREAAYIIGKFAPQFPAETIHVVVIDPGVGTERRPIAAHIGNQFFVCPDNGLITQPLELAERNNDRVEVIELTQRKFWQPVVSHVFHGRDIFSPCAAHLANGIVLTELGSPINDPVRLQLPKPEKTQDGWRGEIIYIDHFGNVSSNFLNYHCSDQVPENVIVKLNNAQINGLVKTFGERPSGLLIALFGSSGNLIVSVVNGSAAERLGVKVGDDISIVIR
jgi:S-adenosylmethionine hydrolase